MIEGSTNVHFLLTALVITAAIYVVAVLALMLAGRRAHARELAALLPNLLRLFKGLIQDSRVPRRSKAWLVFAAAWIASPIDLLPEFLPQGSGDKNDGRRIPGHF